MTAQSGDLANTAKGVGTGAAAGDFDNDGKADLFVLRYRASALYHNDGNGRFTDVTAKAKLPDYPYLAKSVAFVDYDHDGDLDILIGGGSDIADVLKIGKALRENPPKTLSTTSFGLPATPGLLLRNNGDGTFADQTSAARLSTSATAYALVPTDDNRRDIDIMSPTTGHLLWRTCADGTFKDVAQDIGRLPSRRKHVKCGCRRCKQRQVHDFYFAQGALAGYFALSDGREHFQLKRGPVRLAVEPNSRNGKIQLCFATHRL